MSYSGTDPEKDLLKQTFRRGGPMDAVKLTFTCQQCGQTATLSLRQAHTGKRPKCKTCDPGTRMLAPERPGKDASGST